MKKILSILTIVLLAAVSAIAQSPSPGIFNYQGVARNSVGNVLINKTITLRLTIHDGAAAGPIVYQESRSTVTNPFGLFNVQVGSAGATNVTGTIAGVVWGVNTKFIQVEIDPNGGTTFINIGTAQLASVPYSLYSSLSNDLVLPFNKTQSDAGTLFRVNNSGSGNGIMGTATSGNGVNGTSTSAFGVSGTTGATNGSGVLGDGTGTGASSGVMGRSGEGSYPVLSFNAGVTGRANANVGVQGFALSGIGVYGNSRTGRAGLFENTNASNTADVIYASTNSTSFTPASVHGVNGSNGTTIAAKKGVWGESDNGIGVYGTSGTGNGIFGTTGTGPAGIVGFSFGTGSGVFGTSLAGTAAEFTLDAGNSSRVLNVRTAGTGVVGNFENTNAANNAPTVSITQGGTGLAGSFTSTGGGISILSSGTSANTLLAQNQGTGAAGLFQISNPANSGFAALNGITQSQGPAGQFIINNAASSSSALRVFTNGIGFAGSFTSSNGTPKSLFTQGGIQLTGLGEANNFILRSDAAGNATWVDPAIIAPGSLLWTRSGTNLWNTNLGDNVGIGTNAPSTNLHVAGDFRLVNGSQGAGKALVSDANGVGTWQTLSGVSGVTGVGVTNYIPKWTSATNMGASILFEDASGEMGLGTATPTYRLDILHGGGTGINIQSTSSFSVVDIDASSGDASLRFAKAGVNQWNTRNNPSTDDYQIFELGGGGERFSIKNTTGNIAIGGSTGSYRLDVEHGGGTGIRSKSTSSFSVVDIDASSGDAALRFAKAGVYQWNIRNQPGSDNLQIFELGGGGERMAIQNGTGNVAIGGSTGAYRLDILHDGGTGILNKSTASFSVVDIDAFSGDAALRFLTNGVGSWNTRNEPGTDNYQISEEGVGERFRIDNTTGNINIAQNLNIVGSIAKGSGTFKIDHPLDPENKYLLHSFVESPDMMNIYNGNIVTDASGKAVVKLPDYFQALNMEFRYQLTVIGSFAQAIISKKVNNNQFEIATNVPNIEVSWQVTGVRKDAYANKNRIVAEVEKDAKDKGKYLHPKAFNLPDSKGIGYTTIEEASSLKVIPVKVANKVADNSGSVAPQTEVKKAEVKPVEVKGTSVEDVKKPATQEKKPVINPGSTKTD